MNTQNPPYEPITKLLRYYILQSAGKAGSGHPTSGLSAVELMAVLFYRYLRYDTANPDFIFNDRVIFSKGHATPLLYSLYTVAGAISSEELMTYRAFGSNLEGHPTPRFRFAEAATGSLGQGLAVGVGQAIAIKKRLNQFDHVQGQALQTDTEVGPITTPRVFVLLGDGEIAEGSVWEAAGAASYYKLNNLIAVVDVNRLGQSRATMYERKIDVYRQRFEAFGWATIVVDGHSISEIDRAYEKAITYTAGPSVILANTIKGKGVSFLEDKDNWHGKPPKGDELQKALAEIGAVDTKFTFPLAHPDVQKKEAETVTVTSSAPQVPEDPGSAYATRKAFGKALNALAGRDPNVIAVDGDTQNSTYTEFVAADHPDQFLELFIAEQTMVGAATGLAKRGFHPWVSTFGAFLSRAVDQIRMANYSGATIRFNGSHAGISIGEDGPSQMALEDLGIFRMILGSTVVYPADYWSAVRLVEELAKTSGISYIRTSRPDTPILYTAADTFPIGGAKVLPASRVGVTAKEQATVVSAGVTLYEALKAQESLGKEGIGIRVIDCYSVKPIDAKTLQLAAKETKRIVVVEDHVAEGGLGDAVREALQDIKNVTIVQLAVRKVPRSGKAAELYSYEEIDAAAIVKAVKG